MHASAIDQCFEKAPERLITLRELEEHDGSTIIGGDNLCQWTALYGLVYDITEWRHGHPGGAKMLQLISGRDGTYCIESYHNTPAQVKRVLSIIQEEKHGVRCVGRFAPTAEEQKIPICNPQLLPKMGHNHFYHTVKDRVARFMAQHNKSYKGDSTPGEYASTIADGVLTVLMYIVTGVLMWFNYSTVKHAFPFPLSFLCGFVGLEYWMTAAHGVFAARLGFLSHGGNHRAYPSAWMSDCFANLFELAGLSSDMWMIKHQLAHHFGTNVLGIDGEASAGAPLTKLHPRQRAPAWFHALQWMYVPVALTTITFQWYMGDIRHSLRYAWAPRTYRLRLRHGLYFNLNTIELTRFCASKMSMLALHFFLKWLCVPPAMASSTPWTFLLYAVVSGGVAGGTFILNHLQAGLFNESEVNDHCHWAVLNTTNSANWSSESPFWNAMTAGLNHQIEHHLFPSMHPCNYPAISPIVRRTCAEFGLPYNNIKNAWLATLGALSYLYKSGRTDEEPKGKVQSL